MGTAWLTIDDEPFIGEWPSVEDFVLAMIEAYKSFWTTSKEGDLALCKKIMDDIDAYELIFARKEIVRAQNEAARAYIKRLYHRVFLVEEPQDTDMLEPIPLDMLPEYYANAYMIPRSTHITRSPFNMDHGDVSIENSHNSEEMCSKIRKMQGFPSFHSRKHDIMSVESADDHMTSSGDSDDCLSFYMPIHA
ncbi:MAG: hypothetical protein SGBAC_006808 [Bacillariaceae sp.]